MAEAINAAYHELKGKRNKVFVSNDCHAQNIDVIKTRADLVNIEVEVGDINNFKMTDDYFGCVVQYPGTFGDVRDLKSLSDEVHKHKGMVISSADLLALTVLKTPAEMGADITVGTTQRLGLPLNFGGPHISFLI